MSSQKRIFDFFKPNQSMKQSVSKRTKLDVIDNGVECSEQLIHWKKKFNILDERMGASWFLALDKEFSKPYFHKLNDFLFRERKNFTIFPDEENVWSWTKYCKIDDVKVVVIGQDPYHNPGQAHGLCFSVKKGVTIPPSLNNMYKELATDIPGFKNPGHGYLVDWAKQGVLLLNACLTVRKNEPNSHANNGWELLTDAVIKAISEKNEGVIFLLWGNYAQKKAAHVDKSKHHLLKAAHPSPLSASRGFMGCSHFSQCNKILTESGKTPIDWVLN